MKSFLPKLKAYVVAHKIGTGVVALILIAGAYGGYKQSTSGETTTRYIYDTAKSADLISEVTGSGQISALNQVDIQSNVSGTLDSVLAKAGAEVRAGQVIATVDDRDARNAVSNASLKVTSSDIAYQKALRQTETQAATSSSSDIKKSYQAGYDAISNSFRDFPGIFEDVSDIFYDASHSAYFSDTYIVTNVDQTARTYKTQAGALFDKANAAYEREYPASRSITADSDPKQIVSFLDTTYAVLKDLSAGLSGAYGTIDYIGSKIPNVPSQLTTDKNLVSSYLNKVNSNMTAVSNALTAIDDAQSNSISVDLDLKTAELNLKQAKEALVDAQESLADHTIRAAFDGIIAKVPAEYGDKVGSGTAIATLITKKMQVSLSLNEVDAAKVAVGQKAVLEFDAIDGLAIDGTVSEVDVVGTVSQGVVSYGVKIALDKVDDRIKPGMTTSVSIAAGSRTGVIAVPTTAITVRNGQSFIQVASGEGNASSTDAKGAGGLRQVRVTTGLATDDEIEVTSGLKEGDRYVARSITVAKAATAQAPSATSLFGGNRGATGGTRTFQGGGNVQMITR